MTITSENEDLSSAPCVSVIMPVYNGESYIQESVDSIFHQTFQDFELIVIDDGSTDSTFSILESYQDNRLKIIRTSGNSGVANALNAGISVAKGKYIARMDADDICHLNRLEAQVAFLDNHPNIGVLGTWILEFGDVRREYIHRDPISSKQIDSLMLFENPIAHPTVVMRRKVLDQLGSLYSTEYPYVEDWELWLRLRKITQMANMPSTLLQHRVHANSVSHAKAVQQTLSKGRLLRRVYEQLGFPFDEDLLLKNIPWSKENSMKLYTYLNRLKNENEKVGEFDRAAFENVLQAKLHNFLINAGKGGFYTAWFALNHRLSGTSLFSGIAAFLRVFTVANARVVIRAIKQLNILPGLKK